MKQLPEERELRKKLKDFEYATIACGEGHELNAKEYYPLITALVRAVREDERGRCKLDIPHPPKKISGNMKKAIERYNAAIRAK